MRRRLPRRGVGAGLSTVLALGAGVLTNVATSGWSWPTGVGLVVFAIGWVSVEAWRAVRSDEVAIGGPELERHKAQIRRESFDRLARAELPRQLPAGVAGFAGRRAELEALTCLLERGFEQPTGAGRTVVISAISGTAGIGKTALAVCWAHRVADQFPDGQLYVNLRGFDPAGPPMSSAEALRGLLDAFQVPSERIPIDLEAQAALYRSLLAGRRALVILDNAKDTEQVRPLLPGSPECFVVVTSRSRLSSLITTEGARLLPLDLLTAVEARELLMRRIGAGRVKAEPGPVHEIITLCTRLPLALSIVAARASSHPHFPLAALASELRETRGGLAAFDGGGDATDMRVVFSWSYQRLSHDAARLFRLLGLHPGPDITATATASLTGLPVGRVWPQLAELAGAHLIVEHVPGRFAFHDLLRAYATELVRVADSQAEQQGALRRMLDHYLHTAHGGALLMHPRWELPTLTSPDAGVFPERLANYAAVLTWFEAEYPVLLAAIEVAAVNGRNTHAWQIPEVLNEFFTRRGHWHDWIATQHTALAVAQNASDRRGQACAHRAIGRAFSWFGRFDEAHSHLRQALDLFDNLGYLIGQADSHNIVAIVFEQQGRPADALPHAQLALELSDAANHQAGRARALNSIGWSHILLGDPQQGITSCEQALALSREYGDRRTEAHTLDDLGYAHHQLGRHRRAIAYFEQALLVEQELGDLYGRAWALDRLGDAHYATDDEKEARKAWLQALDILDNLGLVRTGIGAGYPDADQIRAKLALRI